MHTPLSLPPSLPPSLPSCQVGRYLELVRRRATGEVLTTAAYIRAYVLAHPDATRSCHSPSLLISCVIATI
ncbi:glutamate cysteine ligase [Nannochloropsis gaditana]|uniref:Glutamate cysteine ligase n=1 Tax=Nannochloropsis gaditana TaxID=72520 RepID=W7TZ43_9STRA|nr:glutamate cysteine ligase [Nannochloropsis gaditana]